jgi:hypothetical protein
MRHYTELLHKALDSIAHTLTLRKRTVAGLLSGRSGVLMDASQQVSSTTDFELITWLIVKDDERYKILRTKFRRR